MIIIKIVDQKRKEINEFENNDKLIKVIERASKIHENNMEF